jgi:hypothetical protein
MYFCEISHMGFSLKSVNTFQFWLKLRKMGILHEDLCSFMQLVFMVETDCVLCEVKSEAKETVNLTVEELKTNLMSLVFFISLIICSTCFEH